MRYSYEDPDLNPPPEDARRYYGPSHYDAEVRKARDADARRRREEVLERERKVEAKKAGIRTVGAFLAEQILVRAAKNGNMEAYFYGAENGPYGSLFKSFPLDDAFRVAASILSDYGWKVKYFRIGWWNRWLYRKRAPRLQGILHDRNMVHWGVRLSS